MFFVRAVLIKSKFVGSGNSVMTRNRGLLRTPAGLVRLGRFLAWLVSLGLLIQAAMADDLAEVPLTLPTSASNSTFSGSANYPITTFSIVAFDPETGDYGIAVQSKYFAVGDVVPFARAQTGALATQARGNPLHGPAGLKLMHEGVAADEVIARLLAEDPKSASRQIGVVDSKGRSATYTGSECLPWAGGATGRHYAAQGNLLAGPHVIDAMAATFENAKGDLATRLVRALEAGQAAGGDARGRQSAAVLVVRKNSGYLGLSDRHIDLHVEDHAVPIRELKRLLTIRHAQLAAEEVQADLDRSAKVEPAQRAILIKRARKAAEQGIDIYRGDDHLWWLTAHARWLDGDPAGAVEAARSALLLSPSWPRLPPKTRAELGVPASLVEALRKDNGFRVLWDSLALQEGRQ